MRVRCLKRVSVSFEGKGRQRRSSGPVVVEATADNLIGIDILVSEEI